MDLLISSNILFSPNLIFFLYILEKSFLWLLKQNKRHPCSEKDDQMIIEGSFKTSLQKLFQVLQGFWSLDTNVDKLLSCFFQSLGFNFEMFKNFVNLIFTQNSHQIGHDLFSHGLLGCRQGPQLPICDMSPKQLEPNFRNFPVLQLFLVQSVE